MSSSNTKKSHQLLKRAKEVIPGGVFGHYKYAIRDAGPVFFSKAEGSHFWDVDDNEYIDLMCAYGPSILGYNHPEVDEAAKTQYGLGNTVSLASPVMIDLATELVDLVDAADWALFGKNGGDSTSLAVMIAREATGREKIIKVRDGYHGVAPWMQPEGSPGTLSSATDQVLTVEWNDLDSFEKTISDHPNEIACFISSPYNHPAFRDNELPQEGYWQKVSSLCKKNGIILIVDDVRAGFRINISGSNVAYGFKPDLICFGKAIANGYPLSALVGSNDLKDTAEKVYFTGTQFFSAAPMAAAKATLLELKKSDAANKMTDFGERLNKALIKTAKDCGFKLVASGIPAMPYYRLDGVDRETHFSWIDHCTKNGVYMVGWHNHFISTAHTNEDLVGIEESAKKAFTALGNSKTEKV